MSKFKNLFINKILNLIEILNDCGKIHPSKYITFKSFINKNNEKIIETFKEHIYDTYLKNITNYEELFNLDKKSIINKYDEDIVKHYIELLIDAIISCIEENKEIKQIIIKNVKTLVNYIELIY